MGSGSTPGGGRCASMAFWISGVTCAGAVDPRSSMAATASADAAVVILLVANFAPPTAVRKHGAGALRLSRCGRSCAFLLPSPRRLEAASHDAQAKFRFDGP